MCAWSWPDVTSSVWRMRQHGARWHSLSYSFRYVVPQFHLPTINSISVIIKLLRQPSSETPCIIQRGHEVWKQANIHNTLVLCIFILHTHVVFSYYITIHDMFNVLCD